MSSTVLQGRRFACLATHGFEQSELVEPRNTIEDQGALVEIISIEPGSITGWKHGQWGDKVGVDKTLEDADPGDYEGLLLPGGVMNPDKLRVSDSAVIFVRAFVETAKPIAAICHGPQILIDAGGVDGRRLTSHPAIRQDLINAGAIWLDEPVVADGHLVTSRFPDDIPAFVGKAIEKFRVARQPA